MTINETIVSLRKSASNSLDFKWRREQYQIAEWLEELVILRLQIVDDCKGYEQDVDYLKRIYGAEPIKEHDEEIYNKAINDFVELAKEHDFKYGKKDITNFVIGFIEFFAEQLKEDKK